jgi:hypothetical protein
MPTGELESVEEVLGGQETGGNPLDEQQAVEALLSGDDAPEGEQEKPERAQEAAPDREVDAEEGGDTPEEQAEAKPESGIDYGQEVPLQDGTKVTLGELKDHYQGYQDRLAGVQQRENEANKKYTDVQYFMGLIQEHIPPEKIEQVQAEQKAYMDAQHAQMVETVPEMATREGYEKLKGAMMELGEEYGVAHLVPQIDSAGFVKMMRDYVELRAAVAKARKEVKPLRKGEPRPQKKPEGKHADTEAAISRAKRTHSHQDETAAVARLLQ